MKVKNDVISKLIIKSELYKKYSNYFSEYEKELKKLSKKIFKDIDTTELLKNYPQYLEKQNIPYRIFLKYKVSILLPPSEKKLIFDTLKLFDNLEDIKESYPEEFKILSKLEDKLSVLSNDLSYFEILLEKIFSRVSLSDLEKFWYEAYEIYKESDQ